MLSFDLLKFSGCNSGRRGVAVETKVLYLIKLIIKKKLEYIWHPCFIRGALGCEER